MTAPFLVATRYLISKGSNKYLNWMSALSVAGISIGIAAMIVVLSVVNGFEVELRNRFLAANAHILAFQFPSGIENQSKWTKLIEDDFGPSISGISPFVHSETMASNGGLLHNILIRGIHPALRRKSQNLESVVRPKESLEILQDSFENPDKYPSTKPIIIGSGLLSLLQLRIGDNLKLVAPESSSLGELRVFKIVGIYDSGLKHYDNKIGILALNDAQSFFKMGSKVHGLEIGLKNPKESTEIAQKMSQLYSLTIKEWQSFNKQMFEAMQMERAVIALIVALVAFVASFNILTTIFITVTQKQKSISILKTLGATNGQIQRTFITQGLFIGIVGAVLGVILAVLIGKLLENFKIVELPDLYLLARLPVTYDWRVYLSMAISGCLVCIIAGIYPAWIASRITIVDGLRGR